MSVILAIDIGTSSTKALAVDNFGKELFSANESYPTYYPSSDFSEQNPDEIFNAFKKVVQRCPPKIKSSVTAISFSSAMHSIAVVDEQGVPHSPLIIWSDLRSKQESEELTNSPGQEWSVKTGTPVHPMSPFCKIVWMKKNWPQFFSERYKFIGIKEYIWFKLFGCFEVDSGIASATGLFTTGELNWFGPALLRAGIDERHLSKPMSVYHHKTLTNTLLHTELGFSKPISCVIGSSDGCLANLGSFAMDTNTLSLTIGTSGAVRRVTTLSKSIPHPQLFRYHLDEQTLIEGGATNNGAVLLDWFSKTFLKEKIDANTFIQKAMKVPAGAEGLIFLPFVFGERAPLYDPDASGVFFGIRQHHSIEHFMRALLEGIGFALYSIAELMESTWSRIIASGGFAQSEQWMQIIANIFGKPVHVNQQENASALGAAMIGFKAIGIDYSLSTNPMKVFEPEVSVHEEYKKIFHAFKNLSVHIHSDFKDSLNQPTLT